MKRSTNVDLADIKKNLIEHCRLNWSVKTGRHPQETINALLSLTRARYQVKIISKYTDPKGKKLLEIGSGYSIFLGVSRKEFGIKSYGIEPSAMNAHLNSYQVSKEILKRFRISPSILKPGFGEKIPYPNNCFDIVYNHYVLEHVQDENQIIKDSVRVLKKDGFLIFVIPNYDSFWEGHYGIAWFPFLNKTLAKIYVKFLGKDPVIIDELNLIRLRNLKKLVYGIPQLQVISWGEEIFLDTLLNNSYPKQGTMKSAEKVINFINKLKLMKFFSNLAIKFQMHTPIIMVAKKVK